MNKYFKKIKRWWNKRKYHQDLPPYRAATKNNVKKEVNENCILGYSVKDEVTKLSDISYEMDNVTVEGYVFGIMPSTKKGFNSFTLKFSDLTTSMYVRIYAKTEEEYN